MASNSPLKIPSKQEKCPRLKEMDKIANFMDSIINDMKSHNQNIQKNKINDISSINTDFQKILNAAHKGIIDHLQAPHKFEVPTPSEKPHTNLQTPNRIEANSQIKNTHNKNTENKKRKTSKSRKSRTPSLVRNAQQNNVLNNNKNEPNIYRNSNITQNATVRNYLNNNPVVQQKASPRKMLVVYKENDKYVTSSLNTMLKQMNKPKVSPVQSINKNRPSTSGAYTNNNNNTRSRSSSVSPRTSNKNARSKSLSNPANAFRNILQQTIVGNHYMHTKRNTESILQQESAKIGMENKKPTLYSLGRELMEEQKMHRSKHIPRPISMNSGRQSSRDYNNNIRAKSVSHASRSPDTPNKNTVSQKNQIINSTQLTEKIKEKTETDKDADNQEGLFKHTMGDSSITAINKKLREIIDEMIEDKESNTEEAICSGSCLAPENKQENETPKSDIKPAIVANTSTPNKPVNNNNKNVNNNINKNQQSKQNMKSASNLVKLPIVNRTYDNNSISICPTNPKVISIPPMRKLSVLTPVEIVQDFVNLVNRAKRDRKTYTVTGNYYSLRRAFAERGWIEKVRVNVMDDKEWRRLETLSNFELVEGMKDKQSGDKYRRIFISKLLAGHQVDFYWDYITNPFVINNDKIKKTLINRFPFGSSKSYATKAGLCESLKEAYWYYVEGYANIISPRTYNLMYDEDIRAFVDDFRRTAVISLLQWISINSDKPTCIISPTGQIPTSVFNFASLQCFNLIKSKEHKDIDEVIPLPKEYEWDTFLEKFYKIIHQGNHFKEAQNITAPLLIDQAKYILDKLRKHFPLLDFDGNMNLWLLKPNNGSCGCGIHVCRTLKYTLDTIASRKETKYVIQKYLERPLLIHNTKFDIRQYFMITCMPNFQIWLYKDCYLRFSSQMYDLSKLHESIHLTNNSIQCRYRNNCNRSKDLPEQNMWHSDTFRKYLADIGQPYAWRNTIYKGIKECLIGLFMLCEDKLLTRVNSFELCGADFMIAEDYRPYLIEINSRPALYPSTRITNSICPKVLEDVVKVTVDYYRNPRASTGQFELIYKDTFTSIPPKNPTTIFVEGINYRKYASKLAEQPIPLEKLSLKDIEYKTGTIAKILQIDPSKVKKDVKNTLEKILAIIHAENNKTEKSEETNKELRLMLADFVDIISCKKS